MNIERGEIYYADLDPGIGCEQGGKRPVVIVQNNIGNKHSPTTIIAPLTNNKNNKKYLPTHVLINKKVGIRLNSIALLEQIRVIDRKRLGKYITKLNEKKKCELNEAMLISLGVKEFGGNDEKRKIIFSENSVYKKDSLPNKRNKCK